MGTILTGLSRGSALENTVSSDGNRRELILIADQKPRVPHTGARRTERRCDARREHLGQPDLGNFAYRTVSI